MKIFLTQLRARCEDTGENFRGIAKLIERSRVGGVCQEDILVLPELIGGEGSDSIAGGAPPHTRNDCTQERALRGFLR